VKNIDQELKTEKLSENRLAALPSCCGKKMEIKSEAGKFIEAWCSVCEDAAYVINRIAN
jgi:hypothetical protein